MAVVYGVVPGICGLTSHGGYDYTLRLPGQKEVYRGDEVQDITATHKAISFDGSISIFRERKRVVVKLDEHGYPFEFNGKCHYNEFNQPAATNSGIASRFDAGRLRRWVA